MSAIPPCTCPDPGWCVRHQRPKTPHLHHLCRTRDDYRALWDEQAGQPPPEPDAMPSLKTMIQRYTGALAHWIQAGRPRRPDEEVDRIYDTICCQPCEKFDVETGSCRQCGCRVSKSRWALINKLRMATEHCPLAKW